SRFRTSCARGSAANRSDSASASSDKRSSRLWLHTRTWASIVATRVLVMSIDRSAAGSGASMSARSPARVQLRSIIGSRASRARAGSLQTWDLQPNEIAEFGEELSARRRTRRGRQPETARNGRIDSHIFLAVRKADVEGRARMDEVRHEDVTREGLRSRVSDQRVVREQRVVVENGADG